MATLSEYQQIALTEQSMRERDAILPPITPYPFIPPAVFLRSGRDGQVMRPQSFDCQNRRFSTYGRAWSGHIRDVQHWRKRIETGQDLPLTQRELLAGNRLICLDYLCDYVVCPDACLRSSSAGTTLFRDECLALLQRRFLLLPYEEAGVFVNVLYDRRADAVSTFDGVERGRATRHDNAVAALRALVERSRLPPIPLVEDRMQSRRMKGGEDRYHGYMALEGPRVFLRETCAAAEDWRDWTSSILYKTRRVQQITETQARVTWKKILDEVWEAWSSW
ncbi:hypothetical protein F5Y05DRAFT_424488 [Hypoxylon sp. FL0543]|nr:hypothetical protein F5Y05DRAFT_424488 [Hypoxylon sp. FL0543]